MKQKTDVFQKKQTELAREEKIMIDEKEMEKMEQVFNKEKTLDNALNVFLCNDYFKKEFLNAPENTKEYLKVSYFTSLISENYAKQHEKKIDKMFADAEIKMTKKDWQYLEDTSKNQQAKYSYRMKQKRWRNNRYEGSEL